MWEEIWTEKKKRKDLISATWKWRANAKPVRKESAKASREKGAVPASIPGAALES
jgi:hypothetical protein